METNQNYEELVQTTKTFLQVITSNDLYYVLFLLIVMIILVKMIGLVFKPLRKKGGPLPAFIEACLKIFVFITIGMRLCSLVPILQDFTTQILMSSSLIVVVLGFVFQEGLSNIVHGFILSVFRPFKIGDRIRVSIDGESITGYIVSMDVRHTVIRNVVNSSHVIVPNSKMDMCVIENNYFLYHHTSSSFVDVNITYESNLQKAIWLMQQCAGSHEAVKRHREKAQITDPVNVLVRELGESSVSLRAIIITETVEENFAACSEIRSAIVEAFRNEPDIRIGYPRSIVEYIPRQE